MESSYCWIPAIDLISENNYAVPSELKERLNINLNKPIVVFTQHSVTTEFDQAKNQIEPSLQVLKELAKEKLSNHNYLSK